MWENDFIQLLNDCFNEQKSKNPRFSIRSFAKKIGLSHGSLSDLMRHKDTWHITKERAQEVLEKLSAPISTKNKILVKMNEQPALIRKSLEQKDYSLLTDWCYYPVLFSFDLPAPHYTVEAIADRLNVTTAKVEEIISDLLKRGLLEKNSDGQVYRPGGYLETSDGTPSEVIANHHEINLEMSKKALKSIPTHRRDFTSLTFVGSEERLDFLRAEIRKLHERATTIVDSGEKNDNVFKLNIQLYPVDFK